MKFITRKKVLQLVRFGIVGVIATAIHYGVYRVFLKWLNPTLAYSIGYAVSFTFKIRPDINKGIGFAFSHGINYILHICLLNVFLYLGLPKSLAPFPVFAIVVPVNFILVQTALTRNKKNAKSINSDSSL